MVHWMVSCWVDLKVLRMEPQSAPLLVDSKVVASDQRKVVWRVQQQAVGWVSQRENWRGFL